MNELLEKYFAGDLSDTEKKELFDQIESNEALKKEFARMQNTVSISNLIYQKGDAEWSARKYKTIENHQNTRKIKRIIFNVTKCAAVIALLVGSWYGSQKYNSEQNKNLFTEIEVPKGQRVYLTLPDGTTACLGSRSKLKIPHAFQDNARIIDLDGEGLFSVSKDEKRPFIVKTKQYDIRVLGTKFNVFAYSESDVFETSLIEGSVHIYNEQDQTDGLFLQPNEKATLEDNKLVKKLLDQGDTYFLQNGIYSFEDKTFGEVLTKLEVWYKVKFNVKNELLLNYTLSGKFRENDSIGNILVAIQRTHSFKFKEISENEIEIY